MIREYRYQAITERRCSLNASALRHDCHRNNKDSVDTCDDRLCEQPGFVHPLAVSGKRRGRVLVH